MPRPCQSTGVQKGCANLCSMIDLVALTQCRTARSRASLAIFPHKTYNQQIISRIRRVLVTSRKCSPKNGACEFSISTASHDAYMSSQLNLVTFAALVSVSVGAPLGSPRLSCKNLTDVGNCLDGDRFGIAGGCVWHYNDWWVKCPFVQTNE